LGNLIGSNVFNILAVMGVTSMILPIQVQDLDLISNDLVWMFVISMLVLLMVFIPRDSRLNRFNGIVLLGLYIYFIYGLIG
jgi:cation:H+ antiporter